jgi:2-polyprenyl-3-methyl-5-hydroxy-6-metoxy-1,4-benzoquinol methylase
MGIKTIDIEGESTLKSISKADNFNRWMYSLMEHHLEGDVLEIGSGIGNISKYIKTSGNVTLSDLRSQYTEKLKSSFPECNVIDLDLVHADFETMYSNLLGKFDFVFALNVVEHIKEDKTALNNMKLLLKPNGKIFILVPAFQSLYNHFDVALEHFRRYNKSSLVNIAPEEMTVLDVRYFNTLGILGWIVFGKFLKQEIIPENSMGFYNRIVGIAKFLDKISFNSLGLSVYMVLQKAEK